MAINVDRINAEISNNKSFFKEQLRLAKGNKKATLDIQIKRNETLKRLNREMVNVLRDSISQAVDAAKTISDEVLTSQDRIKNATIERAELEQNILNEGLTSYQANANARNAIDEARKALKDAETLDAVTDAEQIRTIQDAQKEKLIEIFEAEKERASTFEKDTIERVEAEQNVKVAAQATKDLLDDIVNTESNLIQLNKAKLSEQEELIETRRISLQAYESAIVEIDKQLAEQRQIVIDVDATKAHSELDILEKRLATLTKGANAAKLELKTLDDKIKDRDTSKADDDLLQPLFKDEDDPVKRQSGGFIPMRNKVGGSGEGDKIKALLEPGEFIIRKDVVKRLGEKAMYALNSGVNIMQQPIKRQSGGAILDPNRVSSRMQSRYDNYINDLSNIVDRDYGSIDRGSQSVLSMVSGSNRAELKIPIIQDMIDSVTSANGKDYSTMKTVEAINNKIYSFISSPNFRPNDPVSESIIDNYRSARDSAISNGLDYVEPEEVASDNGLDLISSIGGTDDTDDTGVKDAIEDINKKIYDTLGFSGSNANNPTSQDLLNKLRAIKNNILENGVSGGWSLSEAINDMMANTTAPISTATSPTNSQSVTNDTTGQASRVTITFVANGASASGSFDATPNTYALLDEIRTAGAAT